MRDSRVPYIIASFVVGAVFVWWWARGAPEVDAPAVAPNNVTARTAAEFAPLPSAPVERAERHSQSYEPQATPKPTEPRLRVRAVDAVTGAVIVPFEAFLSFHDHSGQSETKLATDAYEFTLNGRHNAGWRRPRRGEETVTLWPSPDEPCAVYARADGYTPAAVAILPLSEGQERDVTVHLDPGALVTARVTDIKGMPVPGAAIAFAIASDPNVRGTKDSGKSQEEVLKFVPAGSTDAEGILRMRLPAETMLQLRAACTGYEPASRRLQSGRGALEVTLPLDRRGIVVGVVMDHGVPIEGVVVEAETKNRERAITDTEGLYRLENLPDGEHAVTATLETGETSMENPRLRRFAQVSRNHETRLDFPFGLHTGVLMGSVSLAGQAPRQVQAFASTITSGMNESFQLRVDENGDFNQEVPAGTTHLTLIAHFEGVSEYLRYQTIVEVPTGASVRRNLHFDALRDLRVDVDLPPEKAPTFTLYVLHEDAFSPTLLGDGGELVRNAFIMSTSGSEQSITLPVPVLAGETYIAVVSVPMMEVEAPYQYARIDASDPTWELRFAF